MMRTIFGTSSLRDEGVVIAGIDKAVFEDQFRPPEEKRQAYILISYGGNILFGNSVEIPYALILPEAETGKILVKAEGKQYLACAQESRDGKWQAAINPHFIFNAMESINAAAKLEGHNKIASACTSLGRLMRVAINRQKATVTLEEEMRYIRDYLDIQRFMMGERLEVEFDLEPRANQRRVPSRLLQPLVENAVVHGVEEMREGAVIYITSELKVLENGEEELLIKISDNGADMDEEVLDRYRNIASDEQEKGHFGILSVEKRIRILYGEQYGISLSSGVGEGTVVLVRLRLYHRIVQGLTRGGDERRKRNSRPVFNTGLPGKRTCLLFLFDPAAVRFIHFQTMVSRNTVPLYPAARSRLFFRDRVFQPASVRRLHLCRWRCRRGCLPFWRGLSRSAALPRR